MKQVKNEPLSQQMCYCVRSLPSVNPFGEKRFSLNLVLEETEEPFNDGHYILRDSMIENVPKKACLMFHYVCKISEFQVGMLLGIKSHI